MEWEASEKRFATAPITAPALERSWKMGAELLADLDPDLRRGDVRLAETRCHYRHPGVMAEPCFAWTAGIRPRHRIASRRTLPKRHR